VLLLSAFIHRLLRRGIFSETRIQPVASPYALGPTQSSYRAGPIGGYSTGAEPCNSRRRRASE
jgi:hypothetical protein